MASEPETTNTPQETAPVAAAVDHGDLVRERFAAVAARAGLDTEYEDVVHGQALARLKEQNLEPTRENLAKFVTEMKATKPKLFASAIAGPTTTAPAPSGARSTPTPTVAGTETPYGRWRALKEAGRADEAKAYYVSHERAINRSM